MTGVLRICLGNFLIFSSAFPNSKLRQILKKNLGINLGSFDNYPLVSSSLTTVLLPLEYPLFIFAFYRPLSKIGTSFAIVEG